MVLVQLLSDLHLEYRTANSIKVLLNRILTHPVKADVLALTGDLSPNPTVRHDFLIKLSASQKWEQILFVPGNHDYWATGKRKYHSLEQIMADLQHHDSIPRVKVLMRTDFRYHDVMFLGCTLWSKPSPDLDIFMKDFEFIPDLTVNQYQDWHDNDLMWLEQNLKQNLNHTMPLKTIVLTHHLPSFQAINPKYINDPNYDNTGYATDLEHLFYPGLIWGFGHSHMAIHLTLNGTELHCNPLGSQCEKTGFIIDKIIVL